MKNKFELEINKQADILLKAEHQFNFWGYVKLALCVLFVVTSCFMIAQWNNAVFKIGAGSLFIIQIFAWIYHVKLGDTVSHAKSIIEINERYISRIDGKWVEFNDDGKEFADQEHPYCNDLDIMGNKSLFQFLNTARTWHGRQAFANSLLHANYSQAEIKQRQEAVKELAGRTVFTAELEYQFSRIGGDPAAAKLVKELQDCEPFIKNKVIRTVLILMPVIVLIITGFTVIFRLRQLYPLSGILLCLQSLLGMTGIFTASKYLLSVNRLPFKLNAYIDAITLISNIKFRSELLKNIQDKLTGTNGSAAKAIKELSQIFDRASIRGNPLIYYLLNILLLWDFECAFLYQDWKKKYSVSCEEWFIAIGELTGAMQRTDMPPDNNKNPWDFKRSMILMELIGEAGFLPIDVVDFRKQQRWSPYLIGGMGFGVLAPDKLLDIDEDMQTFCGYILLGIGVKVALWERLTLGLEWVMRKTFSDNLDYYAGRPGSWAVNKDWIGTVGLSFSYRLYENRPCAAHNTHTPSIYYKKGRLAD